MSKKDVRLENKKRKAAAFLELVKHDTDEKKPKIEEQSGVQNLVTRKDEEDRTVLVQQEDKALSDKMLEEYKRVYRERRKANMQLPKVFLTLDELARYHPYHVDENGVTVTPPLFMTDVQHLLLFAVLNDYSSFIPRWCRLLRVCSVTKVVAVVLDSLSDTEFTNYPESLPTLHQAFDLTAVLVPPAQYGSSVREDIMNVPIRIAQLMNADLTGAKLDNKRVRRKVSVVHLKQKWANYKAVRDLNTNPLQAAIFTETSTTDSLNNCDHEDTTERTDANVGDANSCENEVPNNDIDLDITETDNSLDRVPTDNSSYEDEEIVSTWKEDKYDRRWLMLNSAQILMEGIPSPAGSKLKSFHDFAYSKHEYKQVTEKSPIYAVDCEMVQSRASRMDLARVSIVDENLEVVLDTYVKPRAPIVDYVTRFSGITRKILEPINTRIEDVQRMIQACLPPDAILCGQSIGSDLSSMKLFHPYIIDTSVIYNLSGTRAKTGLKTLTNVFLKRTIQNNAQLGHSSVEDAMATMELVLLKLRKAMDFGDVKMTNCLTLSPSESVAAKPEIRLEPNTSGTKTTEKTADRTGNTESKPNAAEPKIKLEPITSEAKKTEKTAGVNTDNTENKPDIVITETSPSQKRETDATTVEKIEKNTKKAVLFESLTKTLLSDDLSPDMKRKRLFFQQEAKMFIEPFTQKLAKHNKKGIIVDEPASQELYPSTVPVTACISDKECERKTIASVQEDSTFCLSHLYGFRNYLRDCEDCKDEEELKKCLWKLDRRFWKIMMGLPQRSLFVVILPGRSENGVLHEARAFAKIVT